MLTPVKLNTPEVHEQLITWAPDLIVVVAYGQFLGARILALPPLGCVNVHLSLLPLLRGGALARDLGSRADLKPVDDPDGSTPLTKQADIDADQAFRSSRPVGG